MLAFLKRRKRAAKSLAEELERLRGPLVDAAPDPLVPPKLVPGREILLVTAVDLARDLVDVRSAKIADLNAGLLAVEQTSPPLGVDDLDRVVEAVVFRRDESGVAPHGCRAVVAGISSTSANPDGLLLLKLCSDFKKTCLRRHHRVLAGDDLGAVIVSPKLPAAALVDVSPGGALLQSPESIAAELNVGDRIPIVIRFRDGKSIRAEAAVRHLTPTPPNGPLRIGLAFLPLAVPDARTLEKYVNYWMALERNRQNPP